MLIIKYVLLTRTYEVRPFGILWKFLAFSII